MEKELKYFTIESDKLKHQSKSAIYFSFLTQTFILNAKKQQTPKIMSATTLSTATAAEAKTTAALTTATMKTTTAKVATVWRGMHTVDQSLANLLADPATLGSILSCPAFKSQRSRNFFTAKNCCFS